MAVNLSPVGGVAAQFFDNNGNPLTGGKIYTYTAGTTTNQATYTSSSGTTAHSNPIILDSAGRVPGGEIWLTDGLQYKFVIKNSSDVTIGTYDNIIGINSNFVNFLTETEVQTATAGQTVFTLTTMQYQPGTNNLTVYVDGVNQIDGSSYSYVETSSTVVTFTTGLHVGALVKFTTAQTLSTGVTDASLVTYDPPFTGSVATTVEDKLAQTVSVKDFGAVGDGVTDDTAAIQAAIDNGSIYFPAGSYYVSDKIDVPSNRHIDAKLATFVWEGLVDINNNNREKGIFTLAGTLTSSADPTTSAVAEGDNSFTVASGASYAVNDWVYLYGETAGDPDLAILPKVSVLTQIRTISTNTLTVDYVFGFAFGSGDIDVYKCTPIQNVTIDGGYLDDQQVVTSPSTPTERDKAICFVVLKYAQNVHLQGLRGVHTKYPLVMGSTASTNVVVNDTECIDPDWVGSGEGYAIQGGGAYNWVINGVVSRNTRHCVDFTFASYCAVNNAIDHSASSSFNLHGAFEYNIAFNNCQGFNVSLGLSGSSFGKVTRQITFNDCTVDEIEGYCMDLRIMNTQTRKLGSLWIGKAIVDTVITDAQSPIVRDSRIDSYSGEAEPLDSLDIILSEVQYLSGSSMFTDIQDVRISGSRIWQPNAGFVPILSKAKNIRLDSGTCLDNVGVNLSGALNRFLMIGCTCRVEDPQGDTLIENGVLTQTPLFLEISHTDMQLRTDGATVGSDIRPFWFRNRTGQSLAVTAYVTLSKDIIKDSGTKAGTVTTGGNFTQSTILDGEHLINAAATVVS